MKVIFGDVEYTEVSGRNTQLTWYLVILSNRVYIPWLRPSKLKYLNQNDSMVIVVNWRYGYIPLNCILMQLVGIMMVKVVIGALL